MIGDLVSSSSQVAPSQGIRLLPSTIPAILRRLGEELSCAICRDLLADPIITPCQHAYCRLCMERLFRSGGKTDGKCPCCQSKVTKRTMMRAQSLNMLVESFKELTAAYQDETGRNWDAPDDDDDDDDGGGGGGGGGGEQNITLRRGRYNSSTPTLQDVERLKRVDEQLAEELGQLDRLIAQHSTITLPETDTFHLLENLDFPSSPDDLFRVEQLEQRLKRRGQKDNTKTTDHEDQVERVDCTSQVDQIDQVGHADQVDHMNHQHYQQHHQHYQQHHQHHQQHYQHQHHHQQHGQKIILTTSRIKDTKSVQTFAKLFNIQLVTQFNDQVTHVVTFEQNLIAKRTFKLLRGILSGCWIISDKWLDACNLANQLIDEEAFEIIGDELYHDERAPYRARLSRLNGEPSLLTGHSFYLYGSFLTPSREDLITLIISSGATFIPDTNALKGRVTILCDPQAQLDFEKDAGVLTKYRPFLSSSWLLDCISSYQLVDVQPHIVI